MTSSRRLYGALTASSGCPAACCPSSRTSRKATSPASPSHRRTVPMSTDFAAEFSVIAAFLLASRSCEGAIDQPQEIGLFRRVRHAKPVPFRREAHIREQARLVLVALQPGPAF